MFYPVLYESNTIPSQIFAVTCLELILKSSEIETNLDLLIDIVDNFTVRLVFSWKHAFILFEECQLASLSSPFHCTPHQLEDYSDSRPLGVLPQRACML